MRDLDYFDWSSLILVTIGAFNWGLVGLGQLSGTGRDTYNLINIALGSFPELEASLYALIGLAGLYQVYFEFKLYED
ncbi:MAG: DUF378 domain-containing protein [Candidatus Nanohaloarchaea archaeon]